MERNEQRAIAAVVAALEEAGGPLSAAKLAARLSIPVDEVRAWLGDAPGVTAVLPAGGDDFALRSDLCARASFRLSPEVWEVAQGLLLLRADRLFPLLPDPAVLLPELAPAGAGLTWTIAGGGPTLTPALAPLPQDGEQRLVLAMAPVYEALDFGAGDDLLLRGTGEPGAWEVSAERPLVRDDDALAVANQRLADAVFQHVTERRGPHHVSFVATRVLPPLVIGAETAPDELTRVIADDPRLELSPVGTVAACYSPSMAPADRERFQRALGQWKENLAELQDADPEARDAAFQLLGDLIPKGAREQLQPIIDSPHSAAGADLVGDLLESLAGPPAGEKAKKPRQRKRIRRPHRDEKK